MQLILAGVQAMIFRYVGQVCMKSLLLSIPITCMKFRRVSSDSNTLELGSTDKNCMRTQVCRRHIAVASLSFDSWRVKPNTVGLTVESLQAMLGRVNSVHSLKVREPQSQ